MMDGGEGLLEQGSRAVLADREHLRQALVGAGLGKDSSGGVLKGSGVCWWVGGRDMEGGNDGE